MQDFANDKQGGARSQRKRLERKSSLEELRNMKELTRKESTDDPNEVSAVHNLLETSPCSDSLKEPFMDVARHPSWTNGYLQCPEEGLRRMVQARTDITGTFTDADVSGRGFLSSAASMPESALYINQCLAWMAQRTNGLDSMGLQWTPGATGANEDRSNSGTLHMQGFPSPDKIELIPTSSTIYSVKGTGMKKPCAKETPVNKQQIVSAKKTQKRIQKDLYTAPSHPVDNCFLLGHPQFPMDYHYLQQHMNGGHTCMGQQLAFVDRGALSYGPDVFYGNSMNRLHPLHRSLSYAPMHAHAFGMEAPFERQMRSFSVDMKPDAMWNFARTPMKRTNAGQRTTHGDVEPSSLRWCHHHKRGRKGKDDALDSPESEFGPFSKMQAISSAEIGCRANNIKRDHPTRAVAKHESTGRTTFADMVRARLVRTGTQRWAVGHDSDVTVTVTPEGSILYKDGEYNSISSFALAVIRERNPGRRSCDGWKDVKCEGQRLETLRERYLCGCSGPNYT